MRRVSKKGFTLVEVILVIAIIVMLVAVTAIVASNYINKTNEVNDKAKVVEPSLSNMFQNHNKD
ncbi:MAG: type II secretion system GspH family protein [Clostridia bacterium]|nr:type II secretion system GspH family protein [Clostridia bacterium]